MIIPASVAEAYEAALETIFAVKDFAEPRLRGLCYEENWLFDYRLKNIESTLSKLETGLCDALPKLGDLYGTMVVVPTHRHIRRAVELIREQFEADVKPQRTQKPEAFPYDDVHMIARLGTKVSPAVSPEIVRERPFEIQVRTGLQYAWWRATHEAIYKGEKKWHSQRLASQARAALELLDGLLADIPKSAELQTMHSPVQEPPRPEAASWLELWRKGDRPQDEGRFCETVNALLAAGRLEPASVGEQLRSDSCRPLVGTNMLTPLQVIALVVNDLASSDWVERLIHGGRRLLVTKEMLSVDGSLANLPETARVQLI